MELHESLAELVASLGQQVLDDPERFRGALDDYLDEGAAGTGDINLLVDAVRLGAYRWMMSTIASGGQGVRAVEAAGELLARDRGSRDLDSARWACAVLGFAVGVVGDADVRRYRTRSLAPLTGAPDSPASATPTPEPPAPVVAAEAATEPVQPPMPPPAPTPSPTPSPAPTSAPTPAPPPVESPVTEPSPPPYDPTPVGSAPADRSTQGSSRSRTPLLVVVLVLALVGGGFGAWRLLGGDGDGSEAGVDPGTSRTSSSPTDESSADATSPDEGGSGGSVEDRPDYVPVPADPEPLPFEIDAPFVNQPCTGEVVLMLATAGVPDNYGPKLGAAVQGVPGAKVLRASDSCDGFQELHPESGQPIYNAYLGPFATVSEACQKIETLDSPTAWVRELADPSQERELCVCEQPADALPTLGPDSDPESVELRRLVGQVQWAMHLYGLIPKEAVFQSYGRYSPELEAAVTEFQQQVLVEGDTPGEVGPETWERILDEFCDTTSYDVDR